MASGDPHGVCVGHPACFFIPPQVFHAIARNAASHGLHGGVRDTCARTNEHMEIVREGRIRTRLESSSDSNPSGGGGGGGGPQGPGPGPFGGGIVGPQILRNIVNSDQGNAAARQAAERTLNQSYLGSRPGAGTQQRLDQNSDPSVTQSRNIYDAGQREIDDYRWLKLVRTEGGSPTGDVAVNECYDNLGGVFDFFTNVFRRNSIDNKGMSIRGIVHFGQSFQNAYWSADKMIFGDGDGRIFANGAFTKSLDVIGHELTHGVTAFTGNLAYRFESGALNESISDVFGSMLKQYHQKQNATEADWLIGEGIWAPGINGRALRSMSAPGTAYDDPLVGKDPQPSHMQNFIYTTKADDHGAVHINSGIPNHAFYLIATRLGSNSWGKAGQIWYSTLVSAKLRQLGEPTFHQFADITSDIAYRDYGQSVQNVVQTAWRDVGVYDPTPQPQPQPPGLPRVGEVSNPYELKLEGKKTMFYAQSNAWNAQRITVAIDGRSYGTFEGQGEGRPMHISGAGSITVQATSTGQNRTCEFNFEHVRNGRIYPSRVMVREATQDDNATSITIGSEDGTDMDWNDSVLRIYIFRQNQ